MNVILTERINKLGQLGDTVSVKPGYARNFLIPTGRALYATKQNQALFEARRAELEKTQAQKLDVATQLAEKINGLSLVIESKAGDGGKLYGSVGTREIVKALADETVEVAKQHIKMPGGSIREIGQYEIGIHLFSGVDAVLKIEIKPAK